MSQLAVRAGRVGFSPWGALAYNMATNRKFHSFVGKSAKGLYNVGKKMVNRRAQKLRFNNRARANRVGIPGAGQAVAVQPGSASHGGTQSYRGRRNRPWRRKGFGSRRGKGRRRGNRKGGGIMKYLRNMICTPQVTKLTLADAYNSDGFGVRSWRGVILNSKNDLADIYNRRPTVFFQAAGTDPATATTVIARGNSHKCKVTSWFRKFIFQNRANWDMHLKIYECVVRRKKSYTPDTTTTAWIRTQFFASDKDSVSRGFQQPGYAGGADNLDFVFKNPSYTPYMSTHFCNVYRVVKTTSHKIAMNDYINYSVRMNKISFDGTDLENDNNTGFQECIGGWTKMLMFSWVGGPIDNELVEDANSRQTKANCDLFWQSDSEMKFYFEPRAKLQYNISSSNTTTSQLGIETTNHYSTRSDSTGMVAPATQVMQPSVVGSDDVPQLHH